MQAFSAREAVFALALRGTGSRWPSTPSYCRPATASRAGSAAAPWATSISPPTSCSGARSRSRYWPTATPPTRASASASSARRSPPRGSLASPERSRSSTSASGKAARSSSWSTSPAARSRTGYAATAPSRPRARLPPPARAPAWLEQAATALDAAHRQGIVHRDVKPANLLLNERDELRVADFGIASATGMDSMTLPGTVLGTAGYLSPEQARGERATPPSDLYALAVVAYELLSGH